MLKKDTGPVIDVLWYFEETDGQMLAEGVSQITQDTQEKKIDFIEVYWMWQENSFIEMMDNFGVYS